MAQMVPTSDSSGPAAYSRPVALSQSPSPPPDCFSAPARCALDDWSQQVEYLLSSAAIVESAQVCRECPSTNCSAPSGCGAPAMDRFCQPATRSPIRQSLPMWCDVNGNRKQDGDPRDMIFPTSNLIWYRSE